MTRTTPTCLWNDSADLKELAESIKAKAELLERCRDDLRQRPAREQPFVDRVAVPEAVAEFVRHVGQCGPTQQDHRDAEYGRDVGVVVEERREAHRMAEHARDDQEPHRVQGMGLQRLDLLALVESGPA